MALTDLISDIQKSGDNFGVDDATEHSLVEQVLALMNDSNGEVKNLAVKTFVLLFSFRSTRYLRCDTAQVGNAGQARRGSENQSYSGSTGQFHCKYGRRRPRYLKFRFASRIFRVPRSYD